MKKVYETPKVIEHGDVKDITLANSFQPTSLDGDYPQGTPAEDLGWISS